MMIVFIHPCNDQPLFKLRWKATCYQLLMGTKATVGADVASGSRGAWAAPALWLRGAPAGGERRSTFISPSPGPRAGTLPLPGTGDERLFHRCHLLRFSGPRQQMSCLAAGPQLSPPPVVGKEAPKGCKRCLHRGRPNGTTLKRVVGSCLS